MTKIITTHDSLASIPADSDPLVQRLLLAATAPERHASRVAAVHEAVANAYPTASARQRCILLALEADGVGGPGGYAGGTEGSTARMSWAASLGKGRRQATDGAAWTAAVRAAGALYAPASEVGPVAELLVGEDLEWALAYAIRMAYAGREDRDLAAAWAELARSVAARCEPDSRAGRLAARYGLMTLDRLYTAEADLLLETVEHMLDCGDLAHEIAVGSRYERGPLTIEIVEAVRVAVLGDGDPYDDDAGWHVRVSTRLPGGGVDDLIRRGWEYRTGPNDEAGLVRLHETLHAAGPYAGRAAEAAGSTVHPRAAVLAAARARWDAEDVVEPMPGYEDRAVERARREGVIS